LADQERVVAGEPALERFAQRGDLLAQRPLRELGEDLRVVRAGNQNVRATPAPWTPREPPASVLGRE